MSEDGVPKDGVPKDGVPKDGLPDRALPPRPRPDLNESQKRAVIHRDGPILVIAGPGSGKTRVMTHRIAHLIETGVPAHQILAITFTNKAAGEMLRRTLLHIGIDPDLEEGRYGSHAGMWGEMDQARPVISTFHSFCARFLRREIYRLEPYALDYTIYDTVDQREVVGDVLGQLSLDRTSFPPRAALSSISRWKNKMVSPAEAAADAHTFHDRETARIFGAYQAELEARNAVDFDDLLLLTVRLLRECPDVLERARRRHGYLLIDEFQDTNRPQYLIARLLAEEHQNLCITGDPDQSIYSWRGASAENFLRFREEFPGHAVVHLSQNYRSTPQIISVASRLTGGEFGERALFTENPDGENVLVRQVSDERAEAREIVSQIAAWRHDGTEPNEIAILYRLNSLSRAIEEEFVRQRVPYAVIGGTAFYQRREVKDVLAYLRAAHFVRDDLALRRIINTPARGVGKVSLERFEDAARDRGITLGEAIRDAELRATVRGKAKKGLEELAATLAALEEGRTRPLPDQIADATERSGYRAHLRQSEAETADERLRNIEELATAAAETEEILKFAPPPTEGEPSREPLLVFLERVALVADADFHTGREDRVSMMTLHAAKGLEFDRVVIPGVEETLIPHSRRDEPEDTDEERRLLFVGITRARQTAVLLHAAWRRRYQGPEPRIPSSFFDEIVGDGITFEPLADTFGDGPGRIRGNTVYDGADPFPAEAYEEDDELITGAWIEHDLLGRGVITATSGLGNSKRISVQFVEHGSKQLVASYAPLRIIAPPDDVLFGE